MDIMTSMMLTYYCLKFVDIQLFTRNNAL